MEVSINRGRVLPSSKRSRMPLKPGQLLLKRGQQLLIRFRML
jgi:hypothetical protein